MWVERICWGCDHYCSNNNDGLLMGCRAFPKGIPENIGDIHSHDTVFMGDGLYPRQVGDFVYTLAKKKVDKHGREINIYQ